MVLNKMEHLNAPDVPRRQPLQDCSGCFREDLEVVGIGVQELGYHLIPCDQGVPAYLYVTPFRSVRHADDLRDWG